MSREYALESEWSEYVNSWAVGEKGEQQTVEPDDGRHEDSAHIGCPVLEPATIWIGVVRSLCNRVLSVCTLRALHTPTLHTSRIASLARFPRRPRVTHLLHSHISCSNLFPMLYNLIIPLN